jgi:hypothetical protein
MFGEEEGISENLTGRNSRWRSDECGRAVRSGRGSNLSSGASEFSRKRNLKEGEEWMRWWIMRLPTPFIWWRDKKWYRGGEMVDGEWSYSMLPFRGEERKGQHLFQKGKGACETALGSHMYW